MIIFIIIAIVVCVSVFQQFEFALLGAFLGFLLGYIKQLSDKVMKLTQSVEQLKKHNRTAPLAPTRVEKPEELTPKMVVSKTTTKAEEKPSQPANLFTKEIYKDTSEASPITSEPDQAIKNSTVKESTSTNVSTNQKTIAQKRPSRQKQDVNSNLLVDKIIAYVKDYFTKGNIVVKVGAIILFFGVAFLLKYAAENSNIPMEVRLIGVAIGAVILLVFGWKLKDKNQGYGLILQGAAIGILYLTLFASFRLYSMIPAGMAFAFLIIFSILTMTLSVLQNSRSLAILSVSGGFLAPVLTSTGEGSHVALFSYYAVLNLGIFAVAWFKSWRLLNLIGFVFTFLIGTAWGVTNYQAADFITAEFFLILFFLLYSAIALIFTIKQPPNLKGYLDATLVFGLPIISFALQAAMVQDFEYGLAWSAFGLGAFYILLAYFILKTKSASLKVMAEAYLALGIIFISLVIPFALDGEWTAAAWAIEGAGLIWIGLRQSRWFAKYFGALVQFAGGIIFLAEIDFYQMNKTLFDAQTLGIGFVAIAALFSSYQIYKNKSSLKTIEYKSHIVFLIWGLIWWYIGGLEKIENLFTSSEESNAMVAFVTLSGIIGFALQKRFQWRVMNQLYWVTLFLLVLISVFPLIYNGHLFEGWGILYWGLAIVSFYATLYFKDRDNLMLKDESTSDNLASKNNIRAEGVLHFISLVALMSLSLLELTWLTRFYGFAHTGWSVASVGLLIAAWIFLLSRITTWPIKQHPSVYLKAGMALLLIATALWSFMMNFPSSGSVAPLAYLPILNPLDIVQGILLLLVYRVLIIRARDGYIHINVSTKMISVIFIFIWLNVILLRSIHAWANIPYYFDTLFQSFLVQTSLSIFWTTLGLTGTILASRMASRKTWIYSAGLLAIVVGKLFVIDLDNTSGIERIVSFVVVGLLLLIVGYFSPLPEKELSNEASEQKTKEDQNAE